MQYIKLHKKLKLAHTQVEDGNIDYRFGTKTEVKENRKKIFKQFGIKPYDLIEAQQIHGTRILPLYEENTKMWRGHNVTGVDGFVMDQSSTAIMIRVADCVPLVLYDPDHHTFGAFHVGWRGAVKNMHILGLEMLTAQYDTNPRSVLAWIGPSAHKCCYHAKDKPEQSTDKDWKPFIKKRKNLWWVDIPGYIAQSLKKAGMFKKNIHQSDDCTVDSETLFSHQKIKSQKEKESRFSVLVQLK